MQAIFEAVAEALRWAVDSWFKKTPRRLRVYTALLMLFMSVLILAGTMAGMFMLFSPEGRTADRVLGAVTVMIGIVLFLLFARDIMRWGHSPPARE